MWNVVQYLTSIGTLYCTRQLKAAVGVLCGRVMKSWFCAGLIIGKLCGRPGL